jgi:hypothetical protein
VHRRTTAQTHAASRAPQTRRALVARTRRNKMIRLLALIGIAASLGGCVVAPAPYGYGYAPAPAYGYGYYAVPAVSVGVGVGGGWHR